MIPARSNSLFTLLLLLATTAYAQTPSVLHDFGYPSQLGGSTLYASLILDRAGNLYGTAEFGGAYGNGVVFRLSRNAGGAWTETVLHSFQGGSTDGADPHASVVMDSAGNLYGTTVSGGSSQCTGGCGVVFRLTPAATGPWTETVLHQFTSGADGAAPFSSVILDPRGNLYGAVTSGGIHNAGVVYKLTPTASGPWAETILYTFLGKPDGASAWGAPAFGLAGHLYGTTNSGGTADRGTIYELTPNSGGPWTEQVLYSFHGTDGADLFAGLTPDASGNLYGPAETGGSANCGVAFELAKNAGGQWTYTILHNFLGVSAGDGENPNALIFDAAGNLYGTTVGGGVDNPGTIFKMTPQPSGVWTETVLYSFTAGSTGAYPSAPLVMDGAGNLYGTTLWGGRAGDTTGGVAFEFTP